MANGFKRTRIALSLGFVLGIATLLLVGIAISRSANQFVHTGDQAARANRVLIVIHELDRTLTRSESEQRGYLVTDQRDYLTNFSQVRPEMQRLFQVLRSLEADEPEEYADIQMADRSAQQKISEMEAVLRLRDRKGITAARQMVATKRGLKLMAQFRLALGHIEAREKALLQKADRQNRTNRDEVRTFLLGGLGFAALTVLVSMVIVVRDSQRRLRAETLLQKSLALQQTIFDSVNAALFTFETDGKVTSFNRTAERWFGYSANDVVGKLTPLAFHDPSELKAAAALLEMGEPDLDVLLEGTRERERVEHRWNLVRQDGSRFSAIVSYSVLRGMSGEAVGFVGVATDLTEIEEAQRSLDAYVMRLEEAQRTLAAQNDQLEQAATELKESRDVALAATRLKSEFLANMSHEIRTPMNGVLGMAHLLQQTGLTDRQRQFVRTIQQSAEGLLTVLNDILDLSKMEAGKMSLEHFPFDLRTNLEDLVESIAPIAHQKGIELGLDIPPGTPIAVTGDAGRLRQILTNLLSNAVKFTDQGEVFLAANIVRESEDRAVFRFSVRDTGIGIPFSRQQRIFESFTQADGSTTRRFGGTGLGLTISRQLAELMGGEIGVKSTEDVGSEFWTEIPLALQPRSPSTPRADGLEGKAILIADDNATNRTILRELLLSWGCRVTEASSGAETIALFGEQATDEYDAVILDMIMPEMDGAQVAKELRNHPRGRQVPIILLSSIGYIPEGPSRFSLFDAILSKPVRYSPLRDTLRMLTSGLPIGPTSSPLVPIAQLSGLRVLVVEDNPVNQLVAVEMLELWGVDVSTADNGVTAVETVRHEKPFDVVLMDVQMPVLDGLQATRSIRAFEASQGGHVPILAMTANAMSGDEERCLQAGMDGYLAKPLQPKDLLARLQAFAPKEVPRAQAGPVESVLDLERFDVACGGKSSLKLKVADRYLVSSAKSIEAILTAAQERNMANLMATAHALKGSSLTIGSDLVGRRCEAIELAARQGIIADEDLAALPAELGALQSELRRIMAELGTVKP